MFNLLPPEMAHDIGIWAMKRRWFSRGPIKKATTLFGHTVLNNLGLAAGFDKNGVLVDVIKDYGFGWVEVGSITYRGGLGNPKPRLFRVGKGLVNRMGLNGDPAHVVAERLRNVKSKDFGVNIAKTHDPDIMGDDAIRDIKNCFDLVKDLGIYTCINISCPNTREGKTFEDPAILRELLCELEFEGIVKLSPAVNMQTIEVCEDLGVKGYVMCNTLPVDRGGLSGPKLRQYVLEGLAKIRNVSGQVIACGGLSTREHMLEYLREGAVACQVYTGFVNCGVGFARSVLT